MSTERIKVILFIDNSTASNEALRDLEKVDVDVIIYHASGPGIPSAKLGNTLYSGRRGIQFLAQGLAHRLTSEVAP